MHLYLLPMMNTRHTHTNTDSRPRRDHSASVQQPLRGVRQDNPAAPRARTATPQPASPPKPLRSHPLQIKPPRTQKRPIPTRKTVQLVLWVKPVVKAELARIAEAEKLSVSATGAAFLEKAIQTDIHTQHGALFDTIIDKAIGRHMRAYSNRLAVLLVRSVFATEQIRSIVTNILSRQHGMTQNELATIITASDKKARGNITHITPQLQTFIAAVQRQLEEEVKQHG